MHDQHRLLNRFFSTRPPHWIMLASFPAPAGRVTVLSGAHIEYRQPWAQACQGQRRLWEGVQTECPRQTVQCRLDNLLSTLLAPAGAGAQPSAEVLARRRHVRKRRGRQPCRKQKSCRTGLLVDGSPSTRTAGKTPDHGRAE